MKLLLVDDEPGIREGLAALLRRKGHEVLTAADCASARSHLDGGDIDLVITDWRLPDGRAEDFVARSPCPVIAMSGHPDEVEGHQAISLVLTKPVAANRLLDVIANFGERDVVMAPPTMPRDVAVLVERAQAAMAGGATVEDDATFITLRGPLPDETVLPTLQRLGGDMRVLTPHGLPVVELRWCRDGRPDLDVVVVAPGQPWPDADEFAVDFDGIELLPGQFGECIDRAGAVRAAGRCVHFLNVPESLLSWASDQGRADDMPMRAAVGPRLPAVLADLWS